MNHRFDRLRHLLIACGALGLAAGGLWVASQGGLRSESWGKAVACILLLVNSAPAVLSLWLGAAGWGYPVCRWLADGSSVRYRKLLQAGAGMAAMLLLAWLLGLAGWLNGWTAWGVCLAGLAMLVWQIRRFSNRDFLAVEDWPNPPWPLLPGLPLAGLYLAACCCPPGTLWATEAFGFDVMSYHLQLPREWLADGRIHGLHHNVYSYLPNLIEGGYMQILAMRYPREDWVYTAQFFHASLGVFATLCAAALVSRFAFRAAATVAALALLALPWVLITGTLAYDEMGALAFGALALLMLFDPHSRTRRGALLIGLLLGAATLAKLTAGAMFIPGVAVVLLMRLNHAPHWGKMRSLRAAVLTAICVAGVLAMLAPWCIRNAAWTGNPVFPFAAKALGKAHWDDACVERWDKGHEAAGGVAGGLTQLGPRWLFNTGYGAVGGAPRVHGTPAEEVKDVARFEYEGGIPLFWLAALAGAAAVLAWPAGRHLGLALGVILAGQLAVWLLFTHHQARFLLPTALPGAVLIGLGAGRLEQRTGHSAKWVFPAIVVAVVGALIFNAYQTFFTQTPVFREGGVEERIEPYKIIDSQTKLDPAQVNSQIYWQPGDHILNHLVRVTGPKNVKVLLVADTGRLIDIHTPMVYSTVFDRSLLGDLFRRHTLRENTESGLPGAGVDVAAVTADLKVNGITHVWVNWSELARLRATYGYDPDVTPERIVLCARAGHWQVAKSFSDVTLFALP